jgi:hypothetical protein
MSPLETEDAETQIMLDTNEVECQFSPESIEAFTQIQVET